MYSQNLHTRTIRHMDSIVILDFFPSYAGCVQVDVVKAQLGGGDPNIRIVGISTHYAPQDKPVPTSEEIISQF